MGRRRAWFYLKDVSSKGAEHPNVFTLEIGDGVYVGAIADFSRALEKALSEAIGKTVSVGLNLVGRMFTVTYHGEAEQFAEILAKVAKATFVAPPELEFMVVVDPNVSVGQETLVVFYRGAVNTSFLELPPSDRHLWVAHDSRVQRVTVASSNPLYPIDKEVVEAVKTALAAASVPVQ